MKVVNFNKTRVLIPAALALMFGVASGDAATITSGDLFFTTYQNNGGLGISGGPAKGTNYWSVHFTYSTGTPNTLVLGPNVPLANLTGADGIIFDPNDSTHLLIGEQGANLVASVGTTAGPPSAEKLADQSGTLNPNAYAVTATPDGTKLVVLPNSAVPYINILPLPLANGTARGVDHPGIVGLAFIKDSTNVLQAYWGDAPDFSVTGSFGQIDLTTGVTNLSKIIDDTASGGGQQGLPSHGLEYDPYSNCIILSDATQIWQLCPDATAPNTFHIVSKVTSGGDCNSAGQATYNCVGHNSFDQTTVDGLGHMFASNNNGDLFFIDYQDTPTNPNPKHLIGLSAFTKRVFLAEALDDIANGGGAPPPPAVGRMTGGGSVFTPDGTRVTHGFELHCDVNQLPNTLEINWAGGNNFHMDVLTSALCTDDPQIHQQPPKSSTFDTFVGTGTGKLNGVAGATIVFTLVDAGEPGTKDTAAYLIKDSHGNTVLTVPANTLLDKGNQQAHK